MSASEYQLLTHWTAPGSTEEIYAILVDVAGYERWWSQVYLDVEPAAHGDDEGLGLAAKLLTKGKMNYTLSWSSRVIATNFPAGFTVEATGDLVGRGVWTFQPHGDHVDIQFDWRVRVEKPLLKHFSFIFKPIFRANHRWAMNRGQEGLLKEMERRRKPKKKMR